MSASQTRLHVLAIYKGTGGRCSEEENVLTPRFEVPSGQIAKAIKAQVYWLEKPLVVKIRVERSHHIIGRATGVLRAVNVYADQRSLWVFQWSAREERAVRWIAHTFRTNVVLSLRKL
jgi:hypothetical protein